MEDAPDAALQDVTTLHFVGEDEGGNALHELRASHVAEVLSGLVGLSSDFSKAGAFGDGPAGSEVLVRPAQEGSFSMEVVRFISEIDPTTVAAAASAAGVPSLSSIIWWATKSARADVSDYEHQDNGMVKVSWQDDTVDEIPLAAWTELQKRGRRRKKQLRQIMAPLSDPRVSSVDVQGSLPDADVAAEVPQVAGPVAPFTLRQPDYDAVRPEDDIKESTRTFDVEAQMSAIDFDDPTRWRVRTNEQNRLAAVEDKEFLRRVATGLAIRQGDIFSLKVREDTVQKNGRTRRTWTVLDVISHRRASHDDDT